jgi:hypothetical protein
MAVQLTVAIEIDRLAQLSANILAERFTHGQC